MSHITRDTLLNFSSFVFLFSLILKDIY